VSFDIIAPHSLQYLIFLGGLLPPGKTLYPFGVIQLNFFIYSISFISNKEKSHSSIISKAKLSLPYFLILLSNGVL